MGSSHHNNAVNHISIGVYGVVSGAILVGLIHCIALSCRNTSATDQPTTDDQPTRPPNMPRMGRPPRIIRVDRHSNPRLTNMGRGPRLALPVSTSGSSSTGSSSDLLAVHKYSKEFKEGTCVVCLGEFEEDEEVRIMPECAHVFHVSCIDMWLFSHDSCPLCRANATPRAHEVLLSILS
ncbi:hypothetical protein SSX86_027909 [Deinandra increscens subsp. villosa]|uniref:RING-type domain-containing protein n=1 Tax=Deinandra increscens subsp. villosa TaxID=3103831 RepID=A0AAP0GJW2_9ASTR